MKQTFYSNGKLLLTGEYVVLDGAKALALPARFGQDMTVEEASGKQILWKSFDHDGSIWFDAVISFDEIKVKPTDTSSIKTTLANILYEAAKLNAEIFDTKGYSIETHLTFPRFWGLGTSSTLINNIAAWLQIDAFTLLHNSFGGSGYDIACAKTPSPLLYQLIDGFPIVNEVNFRPSFSNHLYFVYLNRKQSSKAAIASYYNNRNQGLSKKISEIDRITNEIMKTDSAAIFARLLEKHEAILSDILEMKTVKENFFPDFDGVIKSLGGWGGDFILAVSKTDPSEYFKQRGFNTIIPYSEIIL